MKNIKLFMMLAVALVFASCHSNDNNKVTPTPNHTLLVYMVADNTLNSYSTQNISSIVAGAKNMDDANLSNILVYCDNYTGDPSLIRISKENKCEPITVKTYTEANSASVSRLSEVINYVLTNYQAKSYGLILWSHADGWLPASLMSKKLSRSFGDDDSNSLDINDLSRAIPDNKFEYIFFDACLMQMVEDAYELRNDAEYLMGGTTETSADGYPYTTLIPMLTQATRDYKSILDNTYSNISAAMSVVKLSEMDNLASTISSIYKNHTVELNNLKNNLNGIQYFDDDMFDSMSDFHISYDLEQIIEKLGTSTEISNFKSQLAKTVLYKAHVSHSFGLSINHYCGLSTYVFGLNSTLDDFYKTLGWYNIVY